MRIPRLLLLTTLLAFAWLPLSSTAQAQEGMADDLTVRPLPPLVTGATAKALEGGARYLAKMQRADGSWLSGGPSGSYPTAMTSLAGMAMIAVGNTPTRGRYANHVRKAVLWMLKHQTASGVLTGPGEGRNMYGHGFGMMFLGTAYGNTSDRRLQKKIHECLKKAVTLTARSQSTKGGWYYTPESRSDEGSVTITQMQGLRAARNAGVNVPEKVMKRAVGYLKLCQMADGGICYSASSRGGSRPAISAAAACCMYSAGAYDSPVALKCLAYCKGQFGNRTYTGSFFFYTNFYWAQCVYQLGDKEWKKFYPGLQKTVLSTHRTGASWNGNGFGGGTGPVYGTSLAMMILALPYKNVPIFQR